MFSFFRKAKNPVQLLAPVDGEAVELACVKDPVFAEKMLGDGVAIVPSGDQVVAPANGRLSFLMDTGHAFGMKLDNGMEVLVHIGIDTVELKGRGFKALVLPEAKVHAGEPVIQMDRTLIRQAGYDDTTMLLVANHREFQEMKCMGRGRVQAGKTVMISV